MADAFDEDGMNVLYALANIGDDASLGNLPVAVLPVAACLVYADVDAVEVEVGQLSVALFAEIDAAVVAETEDVHEHGVVGVVNPIGVGLLSDYSIDDIGMESPPELPHVGGIGMAVKDARHIGAVVNSNELAAQRITVTMLEENLFDVVLRRGSEVHRHVFAIERQAAEGDTQHSLVLRGADGRRIFDDAALVLPRLLGIVELYASHLSRGFNGKERLLPVCDNEEGTRRTGAVGQCCAASSRAVSTEESNVSTQDEASLHGITALSGLYIQYASHGTHLVDGSLKVLTVLRWRVARQYADRLHREPALCLCLPC